MNDSAAACHPEEACGLLVGKTIGPVISIERLVLSPNRAADPFSQFEIDPALHIRLNRELRGSDQKVMGVWHSHPRGPAEPSDRDRAMASYAGWVWLISGRHNFISAWLDDGAAFRQLTLATDAPISRK